MIHLLPSSSPLTIAYLTDVEGLWSKFESFVLSTKGVSFDPDGYLLLSADTLFIFGGDAIDRGAQGRRIVTTLLKAQARYPDRVILLAGNRDINKMRLRRELMGFPPSRTPEALRQGGRPELLRWIFNNTMGASLAFDCRYRELLDRGQPADEEAVVESFLTDLTPDGDLARYLSVCQLAFRAGGNLFVHGNITPENVGRVPGSERRFDDVDEWIQALNCWYRDQIGLYLVGEYGKSGQPAWLPIIAYQAPLLGTKLNQTSVVYARPTDDIGNPMLPPVPLVEWLKRGGIFRVIVGHSPIGDCPALLRTEGFELLLADNSYSPVESGCRIEIRGDHIECEGPVRIGDGERVRAKLSLGEDSLIGRRIPTSGYLIKGQLSSGDYLLFRSFAGFQIDHRIISEHQLRAQATEEVWPIP